MEVTCQELHERLERGEKPRLIDCREIWEHNVARIEGSELIPMDQIPAHLEGLRDNSDDVVVYCHHGVRSLQVVRWLRQQGVSNCCSLAGGIDFWSQTVDTSVPRY
jgi:rhodanese-related sulfurtransferase